MSGVLQTLLFASGSSLKIQDVFDIDTWTGNGGVGQTISTSFTPNMVWSKSRSTVVDHAFFDTTRGSDNFVSSNTSNAETTGGSTLTNFLSNGYTLGSDVTYGVINYTARTYVGWSFAEHANFFDVISWTGNGSTQALAHSLGVAPGLVVIKGASIGVNGNVWHRSITSGSYLILNQDVAEQTAGAATRFGNNTITVDPTSSTLTIGNSGQVNSTGQTYIAYLFASDATTSGLIYCGGFTTDGSGAATVSALAWEPQWILIKRSDSTGDWLMLDTTRGWGAGNDALLAANTTAAESSTTNYGAPTSTGFTASNLSASATYIYMAIRKGPM